MKQIFSKITALAIAFVLMLSMSVTAFASENPDNGEASQKSLEAAYEQIMTYASENNIELGMTFDDFINNYDGRPIEEYVDSYYSILLVEPAETRSSSSGGGSTYYYNTGYSCPSKATYSKYNLLDVVQKGDVIYEANGGFGITGHIAIVEGIYSRNDGSGGKYIRLIEAISNSYGGVTRSILDDTRVDEKAVTILRVKGATADNIDGAVSFCQGEVGSSYKLDLAKDTSADETDWYCSELVWAAYWNQGIDIEVGGMHGEPGVTPHDIVNSSLTKTISYSEQ